MPAPDFVFSVRFAGCEPFDNVLGEVAATVFRHVGCSAATVGDLVAQLSAAVTSHADGESEFDVRFRVHAGSCEVVVTARGREIWRTSQTGAGGK